MSIKRRCYVVCRWLNTYINHYLVNREYPSRQTYRNFACFERKSQLLVDFSVVSKNVQKVVFLLNFSTFPFFCSFLYSVFHFLIIKLVERSFQPKTAHCTTKSSIFERLMTSFFIQIFF